MRTVKENLGAMVVACIEGGDELNGVYGWARKAAHEARLHLGVADER